MTPPSKTSFRILLGFVIVAIALAAFELGVLWQARTGKSHQAPAPAAVAATTNHSDHTSSIIRKSIRAEFNPQSALLIGANDLVRFHQTAFKEIIQAVHDRIPIIGFVNNEEEVELGQDLLDEAGVPGTAVSFIVHPLDSMWIRDFGPQFARWSDGTVKVIHAVYDPDVKGPREHDDELSAYIGRVLNLKVERMPLTLEGGNIQSNGDGLMVTSTEVMERPENRGYTLQQIGSLLQTYLGCETWVYLRPLEGEPTGHIDFCLTFLRRNLVVVGQYDKAYDPVNAGILDQMAKTLAGQKTSMGPLVVERIPMPPRTKEGDWRSYCNVLLVNGIILMPSYSGVDPAMEEEARKTYARLLPSWKIASIKSDTLIKKRGVLHCIGSTIPGYVNALPLIGEAM